MLIQALALQYALSFEQIIDNTAADQFVATDLHQGSFEGCDDPYGGRLDYLHDAANQFTKGHASAVYYPDLPVTGLYEVSEWHPGGQRECSEYLSLASFQIQFSPGSATALESTTIDQSIGGGRWNHLGNFNFTAGKDETQFVKIASLPKTSGTSFYFIADAVRFVLVANSKPDQIEGFIVPAATERAIVVTSQPHNRHVQPPKPGSFYDDMVKLKDTCSVEVQRYCNHLDGIELCNCLCAYSRYAFSDQCMSMLEMFMEVHHNGQPLAFGNRSFMTYGFALITITGVLASLVALAGRRRRMAAAQDNSVEAVDISVFQASPLASPGRPGDNHRGASQQGAGFLVLMNPGDSNPQIAVPVKSSSVVASSSVAAI
jgi:hypothetical protein